MLIKCIEDGNIASEFGQTLSRLGFDSYPIIGRLSHMVVMYVQPNWEMVYLVRIDE